MELATQVLTEKPRKAYYWRLFATATAFALFGLGGLCLRVLVFPLLSCLPGDAKQHQRRARHTISCLSGRDERREAGHVGEVIAGVLGVGIDLDAVLFLDRQAQFQGVD